MKRILIIVLAFAIVLPSYAQKKLTLQEAVSIALQGNSALIKMKNNLQTSKASVINAYGKLAPSLGASAGWNWQRVNDAGGKQRDYLGVEVITPASETDSRNYSVGFGSDINLFDGLANYATVDQAEENLNSAEFSISKQKQDIVFQTTNLYYIVLNADELLKVREENLQYYKKFLETVQEKNRLGSVAIADVYAAQVQAGNADLQLIQAQNDFETAKNNLLNYLALDVMDEYTFQDPFGGDKNIDTEKYMNDFNDVRALVNAALDSRFDYKSQLSTVNAAENGVTIAKGGVFPSLSGSLQYYTYAVEPSKLFDRKVLNFGLTLSIPIFSNFNVATRIQSAEATYLNAKEDLSVLSRQIKIEVKQGYNDFVAAKKSLDVASNNVTAAAETRKINQERYNLGSATILDVLQASRDYTDAQRNKINAAYDFYRQHDNLTNALGRLDFSKYE